MANETKDSEYERDADAATKGAKVNLDDMDMKTDEADLGGYDDEAGAANLVPYFAKSEVGRAFLAKVGKQACDDFQQGWDASEEYRSKREMNERVLTGFMKQKDLPFAGCANAHTPLMLERLLRLEANVYVEIFADKDTLFVVNPTGAHQADIEESEILTFHGNYQIQNELTDFLAQQQRGIHEFFAVGSVFCHSYRDQAKGVNRHDILNCEDFVIPYVWTTVATDLSDVPWKAKIVRKYRREVEEMRDTDEWAEVEAVLKSPAPGWDNGLDSKVRDLSAKQEGIRAPENDTNSPYVFYEYHGWYLMPGGKKQRPICCTVDRTTRTVVKLYLREEDDWRDRKRYEMQMVDAEQYQQSTMAYQAAHQKEQELRQRLIMPDVHPEDRQIMELGLRAEEPLEPPTRPTWAKEGDAEVKPAPVKRVPVELFSHGKCWDITGRSLGLSFGNVLADLNKLADESYNRLYDAATLANCWSLIKAEGLDIGGQQIPFGPGKVINVKLQSGDDLNRMIRELKPSAANPQLMEVVRFAHDNADSSVAAPGILSGEAGKSGETYRGLATRVERATRQLSMAGMKYLGFLENILRNNAKLNSLFMADEEIIEMADLLDLPSEVTDATPERPGVKGGAGMRKIVVNRDLYRRQYNVTFTADVRFSSQADRVKQADELVAMMNQLPPLQGNPAYVYAVIAGALRARGRRDLIQLLGPPPAKQTTPMGPPPAGPPGGAPPGAVPTGPPQGGAPQPMGGSQ